jgi:hypothetical protein
MIRAHAQAHTQFIYLIPKGYLRVWLMIEQIVGQGFQRLCLILNIVRNLIQNYPFSVTQPDTKIQIKKKGCWHTP